MAITPQIRAPQGLAHVVYTAVSEEMDLPQAQIMAVYNVPAENVNSSHGGFITVVTQQRNIKVEQALSLAVVRGHIANPRLRAWTFDLDGHEFYVLRLGDGKTLLYDRSTEKWSWWSSANFDYWRVAIGTNWTQSGTISASYGSSVVVGDDSTGILWILDPDQGYDDSPNEDERTAGTIHRQHRVATGMIITRARNFVPCWQVFLFADAGEPVEDSIVTLQYSDTQGRSYVSAGSITVQQGNYQQDFQWGSLGQIGNPGRFFRIEDDGAFKRINELTVSNG